MVKVNHYTLQGVVNQTGEPHGGLRTVCALAHETPARFGRAVVVGVVVMQQQIGVNGVVEAQVRGFGVVVGADVGHESELGRVGPGRWEVVVVLKLAGKGVDGKCLAVGRTTAKALCWGLPRQVDYFVVSRYVPHRVAQVGILGGELHGARHQVFRGFAKHVPRHRGVAVEHRLNWSAECYVVERGVVLMAVGIKPNQIHRPVVAVALTAGYGLLPVNRCVVYQPEPKPFI